MSAKALAGLHAALFCTGRCFAAHQDLIVFGTANAGATCLARPSRLESKYPSYD